MIQQKYRLSNGDLLVWLGNQPIHGCEDVFLLAGGDVLFLERAKVPKVLRAIDVQQDMKHLIVRRDELPNGNTFVWLGDKKYGCEYVLVLAGGDALFLKPAKVLKASDVRQDVGLLDRRQFFEKYGWPDNSSADDLHAELKGVR